MEEKITLDELIQYLNDLLDADRPALRRLLQHREPVNEAMEQYSRVQLLEKEKKPLLGILGILAGLFSPGDDGWPPLVLEAEGVCTKCGSTVEKALDDGGEEPRCQRCMSPMVWMPVRFTSRDETLLSGG